MTMERLGSEQKRNPTLFDEFDTGENPEIHTAATRVLNLNDQNPVVDWPVVAIPGAVADEWSKERSAEVEKESAGDLFTFRNFEDVENRIEEGLQKSREGGFGPKVQDAYGHWVNLGRFLAVDVNRLATAGIITREQDSALIKTYLGGLPLETSGQPSVSRRQDVFQNHPSHGKSAVGYSERYTDVQSARANDRRDDD